MDGWCFHWDFMQIIYCVFLQMITGEFFNGFSADGDKVMDGLPDGSTDKSNDVLTEWNFPVNCFFREFCTGILMGIFTMNLDEG